jgi:hypothetical protein
MFRRKVMRKKRKTEPVKQPVLAKTAEPADDLADTIDQFLTSMTTVTQRSFKSMLTQFSAKADAAIAKLDEAAGGAPPKRDADGVPPKKPD